MTYGAHAMRLKKLSAEKDGWKGLFTWFVLFELPQICSQNQIFKGLKLGLLHF